MYPIILPYKSARCWITLRDNHRHAFPSLKKKEGNGRLGLANWILPAPQHSRGCGNPFVIREREKILIQTSISVFRFPYNDIHKVAKQFPSQSCPGWRGRKFQPLWQTTIDRFKARLVVQGNNQHEGIDFNCSHSPFVKPATIRCVLGMAITWGWKWSQIDVRNVFLSSVHVTTTRF